MRDKTIQLACNDALQALDDCMCDSDYLCNRITNEDTSNEIWGSMFKDLITKFCEGEIERIRNKSFYVIKYGDSYVTEMSDNESYIEFTASLEDRYIINFESEKEARDFLAYFKKSRKLVEIVKIRFVDLFNENHYEWWEF